MRAFGQLTLAALLLAGCETAFIGTPPGGRYELAAVKGRAVPLNGGTPPNAGACHNSATSGHLTLDSLSRRFELHTQHRNSCTGQALPERRVAGSYLRAGRGLTLEVTDASGIARRLPASEGGRTITVQFPGERLLFRQAPR